MRLKTTVVALAMLALSAGTAHAQFNAYALTPPLVGNQVFAGSLGLDFDVNSTISVSRLGAFDSAQDGLLSAITVAIYDRNTQSIVPGLSIVLSGAGDPLVGAYRFAAVAPVNLAPGNYSVVASGYSSVEPNGNVNAPVAGIFPVPASNTGGGLVSYVGGGRYDFPPGVFPTNVDGGPAARYGAGNFTFVSGSAAAPEPGAGLLLGAGLMVAGIVTRRKRA